MIRAYKVLHVEDNPGDTLLFSRELSRQKLPIELIAVRTGEAAMQALDLSVSTTSSEYSGVSGLLLDLNLPGMSGAGVLQAISKRSELDHLIVAFLTSAADTVGYDLAGAEMRVSRHFTKPSSPAGYQPIAQELIGLLEKA